MGPRELFVLVSEIAVFVVTVGILLAWVVVAVYGCLVLLGAIDVVKGQSMEPVEPNPWICCGKHFDHSGYVIHRARFHAAEKTL